MSATATTEREVKTLPYCDIDDWNRQGAEYVAAKTEDATTAEERARVAGKIAKTEAAVVEKYRPLRDAAAFAIAAHYWVRRGANLSGALGVNRTRWKAMKDKCAADLGYSTWDELMAADSSLVPDVEDAPRVLADAAKRAGRANGRFHAARKVRDAAVAELLSMRDEAGKAIWTNAAVSDLIGTDPSRVSHIKHKGAAA